MGPAGYFPSLAVLAVLVTVAADPPALSRLFIGPLITAGPLPCRAPVPGGPIRLRRRPGALGTGPGLRALIHGLGRICVGMILPPGPGTVRTIVSGGF